MTQAYNKYGIDFRIKHNSEGEMVDAVMTTESRRLSCYRSQMSNSWTIALDKISDAYGEREFRLLRMYRGTYEEMIKYWDKKLVEFKAK